MRISAYELQRQIAFGLVMWMASPLAALAQQPLPPPDQGGNKTTSAASPPGSESAPPAGPQTSTQEPPQTSQPVGTAAAPYEKTSGVAASRPAGAVIAPAKQRRTHSLLIKLGLIIGGAAAIGTVVALSRSSPARPN